MPEEALELVRLRNQFYRDNFRRTMSLLMLSVLMNAGLMGATYYFWKYRPKPEYFATTPTGQVWKMVPIGQPLHSDADVINWATRAVMASMSYDFLKYKDQLLEAGQYFTSQAFQDYLSGLKKSGNIEFLTSKRLVASPYLSGKPVITAVGKPRGRYTWQITMPVSVEYESSSEKLKIHYEVTVRVVRVSTLETPEGIKLESMVINTKQRESSQRIR